MGLHASVHQVHSSALINLGGKLEEAGLTQIQAIVSHLHGRGCRTFVLDTTKLAPITPTQRRQLAGIIGQPLVRSAQGFRAIRRLAEPSAARPQPGCGGALSLNT
jgi:hypothetical protein